MANMQVSIAGVVLNVQDIRANPTNYSQLLQEAKVNPGHGFCMCKSPELPLTIREREGVYHLAVRPLGGPSHESQCYFYRDLVNDHQQSIDSKNSISESESGRTSISPDFALKRKTEPNTKRNVYEPTGLLRPGQRRAAMLAILQHLWSASKNNRCYGFRRDYSKSMWHVGEAVRNCKLGAMEMETCCHLPGFSNRFPQWYQEFEEYLAAGEPPAPINSGLVIGELEVWSKTLHGVSVKLLHMPQLIYASTDLEGDLKRRFPYAFANHQHSEKVIFIGQVELTTTQNGQRRYLKLINAALMVVTADYIPVDSSHEARVTNSLIKAGRKFVKPLQVDDGIMPDFILTDTQPWCYMEVWGMATPEYLKRKAIKQAEYKKRKIPLWEWDVLHQVSIPPFPAPKV